MVASLKEIMIDRIHHIINLFTNCNPISNPLYQKYLNENNGDSRLA